ncbi:hypothetical protein [Streptomyces halstedii]|uniref:hypothetical protein n=1 Tax=Streptomyces halstedii TaxID=1944 RepID=UPI00368CA78D
MWIGNPGSLREIKDGAKSYDRSPDLGVTEFRALSGGVTTWAPPARPRRVKASWELMQRPDFEHLDALARRLTAPGPVALVDPLAGNLLGGAQAAGIGNTSKWAAKPAGAVLLYGGNFGDYVANTVSVEATPGALYWQHPTWPGVPVAPGSVLTWWVPGLVESGAPVGSLRVEWYSAAGAVISTTTGGGARPMVATVPAGAAYIRPGAEFTATGMWALGASVLALGDVSAAVMAGARPTGEGCPAYSITGYSHAASAGDGRFRDIALELVEVTGSANG